MAAKKNKVLATNVQPWERDREAARKKANLQRVAVLVNGRKLKLAWREKV